jgi:hypothetical protein
MNALELAEILEFALEKDNWCQECGLENTKPIAKNAADMLRQQEKEIEQLTITNQDLKYQLIKKSGEQVLDDFSKDMLQKQAKEIEDFRFVLRNLTLATSKKIGDLEEELENCTCQGGHSEAYLKVKGRLPKQSMAEDLNDAFVYMKGKINK